MKQTISELGHERVYALLQRPLYIETDYNIFIKSIGMALTLLLI